MTIGRLDLESTSVMGQDQTCPIRSSSSAGTSRTPWPARDRIRPRSPRAARSSRLFDGHQRRELLGDRRRDELVDRHAVPLGDGFQLLVQRLGQSQAERAHPISPIRARGSQHHDPFSSFPPCRPPWDFAFAKPLPSRIVRIIRTSKPSLTVADQFGLRSLSSFKRL